MGNGNDMITEKQMSFLNSLVDDRNYESLSLGRRTFLDNKDNFQRLSKGQASEAIKLLLACPKIEVAVEAPVENFEEVLAGRYFIIDPTNNEERFFKVDKPQDGRWKGYTFLKVQGGDDFFSIKDKAHRDAVLTEIAKDPLTAMNEYGIRLGKCGNCGRTLTNIDSRLRGLGPICAGRMRQHYQIELSMEDIQNLMKNAEDE